MNNKLVGKILTLAVWITILFSLKDYDHKLLVVCFGLILTEIERAENRITKKIESNQRR